MRHLVAFAVLLAALAAYAYSVGPLFFGAPVLGWVLFLVAAALEWWAWRRLRTDTKAAAADADFLGRMERITAQVEALVGKPNRTAAEEAKLRELMEQAEKETARHARGVRSTTQVPP